MRNFKEYNLFYLAKKYLRLVPFFDDFYQKIIRRKFNLIRKNTLNEIRCSKGWDARETESYLNDKLNEIISHAYYNTEFYSKVIDKEKLGRYDIKSIKSIPSLNKAIIKDNFEALQASGTNLQKRNTGGSTGEPFNFYVSESVGYVDYAHHEYLYERMGLAKGDLIVGSGGIVLPNKKLVNDIYWIKNKKNSVWGEWIFSALYLNEKNIGIYVSKLRNLQPKILRGYPSFYSRLADYILQNKIDIDFEIKGINLTSEMCTEQQKNKIERAFKTKIFFEYGHTEACVYGYTDRSQKEENDSYVYKTSPVYGFVEVVDEFDRDVPPGEVGEVVATGFYNTGMPFIRYRTGDRVKLSKRISGYVEFSEIYGRSQDFILDKNSGEISLTALIFGQHFNAFKNIKQWQIAQNEAGIITFIIVRGSGYGQQDEDEIREKILGIASIDLNFVYVDELSRTLSGKHLFLVKGC